MDWRRDWPQWLFFTVIGIGIGVFATTAKVGFLTYIKEWQPMASALFATAVGMASLWYVRAEKEHERFHAMIPGITRLSRMLKNNEPIAIDDEIDRLMANLPTGANWALGLYSNIRQIMPEFLMANHELDVACRDQFDDYLRHCIGKRRFPKFTETEEMALLFKWFDDYLDAM